MYTITVGVNSAWHALARLASGRRWNGAIVIAGALDAFVSSVARIADVPVRALVVIDALDATVAPACEKQASGPEIVSALGICQTLHANAITRTAQAALARAIGVVQATGSVVPQPTRQRLAANDTNALRQSARYKR